MINCESGHTSDFVLQKSRIMHSGSLFQSSLCRLAWQNLLAAFLPIRHELRQALVGQRVREKLADDVGRNGRDMRAHQGGLHDMLRAAHRGDQNFGLEIRV